MNTSSNLIGLVTLVVVAAVGSALFKATLAKGKNTEPDTRFKAKALLTPNELEFLARLELAIPEYRFCPQVSMGALLDPAVSRKDQKTYFRLRGMFSQKIVDFVMQDRKTGHIVSIIELDDRTHDAQKDAKRDVMLASAGYRVVRWNSKIKPDPATIRSELLPPASVANRTSDKLSNARINTSVEARLPSVTIKATES